MKGNQVRVLNSSNDFQISPNRVRLSSSEFDWFGSIESKSTVAHNSHCTYFRNKSFKVHVAAKYTKLFVPRSSNFWTEIKVDQEHSSLTFTDGTGQSRGVILLVFAIPLLFWNKSALDLSSSVHREQTNHHFHGGQ